MEILRKDNPSIQLHSTTVGFKASREERKDREAFMVAYFKSSDDSDSFYSRYRMKRELSDDELGGKERILLNAFCASERLLICPFNPDEIAKRSPRRRMTWLLDEQEEEVPGIEPTN